MVVLAALLNGSHVGLAVAQATLSDTDLQEHLRQQERERAMREQLQREPDVRLPRDGVRERSAAGDRP